LPKIEIFQEQVAARMKRPCSHNEQEPQQVEHESQFDTEKQAKPATPHVTDSRVDRNFGEAQLPEVRNAAGNLALHLEGNLREYVGHQLGNPLDT
jgi:hypothetical protein